MLRSRSLWLALACLAVVAASPAQANLVLSFDSPSHSIAAIGGTTTLSLYVTQTTGALPNITAANPLLTGGVQLTFATAGSAVETAFTASPSWDNSSPGSSTSGSTTTFSLTTLSLHGIGPLTSPLLLGSFTFTGRTLGLTTITAATISPGINFIDFNGDALDPTNTPTTTILVGSPSVVPEPGSLSLLTIAAGAGLLGRHWRRRSVG